LQKSGRHRIFRQISKNAWKDSFSLSLKPRRLNSVQEFSDCDWSISKRFTHFSQPA
jgi:hypothetical protein